MTTLSRPLLVAALLLANVPFALRAEPVEIAGLSFTAPDTFKSQKPESAMRKAQYTVGEGEKAGEIVFFYFGEGGAGGVDANVKRWFGQFVEGEDKINAKTEKAKAGETEVTFVSAEGTFKSGPPRGPFVEKPGYALLGAIVEAKEGAIFAKFTGPKETIEAHAEAFRKMITSAE
jgi:hypothetical protein